MYFQVFLILPALLTLFSLQAYARVPLKNEHSNELELLATDGGGCTINVAELSEPQPLFLRPETDTFIIPNDTTGVAHILAGEPVEFFCSTGFADSTLQGNLVAAHCLGDRTYSYDGTEYEFSKFVCKNYPQHTAQRTGRTCFDSTEMVQVGFEVDSSQFLHLFDVCFDELEERTHYVHHKLTPANAQHQAGFPRPDFQAGDFFAGKDLNKVYAKKSQQAVIGKILGSVELGEQFVEENSDFYLARGHLAAKVDFIYGAQQRATFYYINAAPQWQTFNGNNWVKVEDSVRKLARDRGLTLDVYTGTFDTLKLKDVNGEYQPIYLSTDVNNNPTIPVPKFYYRVVIDQASSKGVAIIGVNNPYVSQEEISSDYQLCEDVSDDIAWISWNRENLKHGYGYVCEVGQFSEIVGHLPPLQATGLLT